MIQSRITYWQKELGIPGWRITTERILPEQVTYPKQFYGKESFVGIVKDHQKKIAIIYHDIDLCEDSIIHELLHVRYPTRSEDWVNRKTKELQNNQTHGRCRRCGLEMSLIHSRPAGNCSPKKKQKKWKNFYI